MENVMLLVIGIVATVIGVVNIRRNISTIHSYNRRNVREEDVPLYGKAVGTGTLLIGVALILAYLVAFWKGGLAPYIAIPVLVLGFACILYGQIKYNHGIF